MSSQGFEGVDGEGPGGRSAAESFGRPDGEVAGYAAEVRAQFADLSEAEVAELLEDLEDHLREVAAEDAGTLRERLGGAGGVCQGAATGGGAAGAGGGERLGRFGRGCGGTAAADAAVQGAAGDGGRGAAGRASTGRGARCWTSCPRCVPRGGCCAPGSPCGSWRR